MWFSLIILIVAMLGLFALFGFKALELKGRVRPISKLRKADEIIVNGLKNAYEELPYRFSHVCDVCYDACREQAKVAGVVVYKKMNRMSRKFGEYLKDHGAAISKKRGTASVYLKNVLETKALEATEEPEEIPTNQNDLTAR